MYLRPRNLVELRGMLRYGGEGDPVAVVGEVEEGDGGEEDPPRAVQGVLILYLHREPNTYKRD